MKVHARQLSPHSPDLLAQFCQCLDTLKAAQTSPIELPLNRFREMRPQFLDKLMQRSHDQLPRILEKRPLRNGAISALQKTSPEKLDSVVDFSEKMRMRVRKKGRTLNRENPLAVLGVTKQKQRTEGQSKSKLDCRFPDLRRSPFRLVTKQLEKQKSFLDSEERTGRLAAWDDEEDLQERTWFERTFA